MNRRGFLATAACAPLAAEPRAGFQYRGYLGWITDLASLADTYAEWPSMKIDQPLLNDYRQTFGLMKRLGFEDLCIWGLYVSRAWPVDIPSAVTPERAVQIEKLIKDAKPHGIRVISGLGVYSWGFEEILRANPRLRKTPNKSAMCGSEEESWQWMRKIIDYVFTRFPIDGVSMQSADQGRCTCEKCSRYTDTEYRAMLNIRCAQYTFEVARQASGSKRLGHEI